MDTFIGFLDLLGIIGIVYGCIHPDKVLKLKIGKGWKRTLIIVCGFFILGFLSSLVPDNPTDKSSTNDATEEVMDDNVDASTETGSKWKGRVDYDIISREVSSIELANGGHKITYILEIPKEYPAAALDKIADKLKKKEGDYDNVFISYYLPGLNREGMNYAFSTRTDRESSSKINQMSGFLSASKDERKSIEEKEPPYVNDYVKGKWFVATGHIFILYSDRYTNRVYGIDHYLSYNSYSEPTPYGALKHNGNNKYVNFEDENEIYEVINGDLVGFDGESRVSVFTKIE